MCRLAIYLGNSLIMSKFITEPNHSIIKQSSQASLEPVLQLNGDGFGVSWYVNDITPYPAVFSETSPAWSNSNLLELAKITRSECILAHVRQASPGSPVVATNCHPFTYKKFSFMHNGFVQHFPWLKRKIVTMLSDEAYGMIRGSTDSEHLFALFLDFYAKIKNKHPKEKKLDAMTEAICEVITTIENLGEELKKHEKHRKDSFLNLLNFVVTDGHRLVATRFTSGPLIGAHTMFYCTGKHFQCHASGETCVHKDTDVTVEEHNEVKEHDNMVIIASEPLTDERDFKEIPPNYMIVADRTSICLKSIDKLRIHK